MWILLFIFLVSCTSVSINQDCGLDQLENKFYLEAKNHGMNYIKKNVKKTIVKSRSEWGCGGSATIGCANDTEVMFLESYWQKANCTVREILFFHEYGHAMGKPHVEPPAIMQPHMLTEEEYLKNRSKFLADLYKP